MTEPAWARRRPPAPGADLLGRWEPANPAELTRHRRDLATALHDGGRPAGADEAPTAGAGAAMSRTRATVIRNGSVPLGIGSRSRRRWGSPPCSCGNGGSLGLEQGRETDRSGGVDIPVQGFVTCRNQHEERWSGRSPRYYPGPEIGP